MRLKKKRQKVWSSAEGGPCGTHLFGETSWTSNLSITWKTLKQTSSHHRFSFNSDHDSQFHQRIISSFISFHSLAQAVMFQSGEIKKKNIDIKKPIRYPTRSKLQLLAKPIFFQLPADSPQKGISRDLIDQSLHIQISILPAQEITPHWWNHGWTTANRNPLDANTHLDTDIAVGA